MLNPLKNLFVVFTPFGLGVTAVIVLLICLITKKGYIWFSGYKYIRDPRGFDILPDATHGSSGFQTLKEMGEFLELGKAKEVKGMMLGKYKAHEDDSDRYATYAAHHMRPGPKEADDFWSRAELNLLMALIHYVCNLKDASGKLLPIEQRGLGDVYRMLAEKSINEINRTLAALPADHPAKGHHGLFLKARENLWGNIAIGLGNRLAIFQNKLVDKITRNHDVDLLLPGQKPCAYFVIISAQDSAYRFLSSLFFSLAFPRLSDYARLHCGGRLPVLVNFCLDEYCNIGYMEGISDVFNSVRGFNMACQVVVQSLSQWQEKYPGKDWENQLGTFDQTLYMGCNDLTSAKYMSEKCGKVTIAVTNNQMPLAPLFSPVYNTTRPYSQTKSSTQRDLMQPDEILRLDRRKCIALFQGRKPALLYKLTPEELPEYKELKTCRVIDYVPEWKRREDEQKKKTAGVHRTPAIKRNDLGTPPPAPKQAEEAPAEYDYSFSGDGDLGMVEAPLSEVLGDDELPRR